MKQNTGSFTAVLLAVAAIVGYTVMPSRKASAPTGDHEVQPITISMQGKQETETPAPAELQESPCWNIEKALMKFLPEGEFAAPASCFSDKDAKGLALKTLPTGENLHFIIATLPDPVRTHFPLLFDRLTEALQQSAQDQGYNYGGSWLPWAERVKYSGFGDQKKADEERKRKEKQPGVLVFRKELPLDPNHPAPPYSEGLVVFVTGENPTGGIDETQFRNAVDWIAKLRPHGTHHTIRVLGPFFSGSLQSLLQVLDESDVNSFLQQNRRTISQGPRPPAAVEILSGSVSSATGIRWFDESLTHKSLGRFHSFQENDDLMLDRYCQYLTAQGLDTNYLAIR